jgi:DNA-binding XRE family transcriptional regulator
MKHHKFRDFLYEHSAAELSKKLGVTERTIHYWKTRERLPSRDLVPRIVKVSKGALSIEDIFNYCLASN